MSREEDLQAQREYVANIERGLLDNMDEMESNEGHGFPRPIRDADNALIECAKLLRLLTGALGKILDGAIDFRVDLRFWPPGIDGHFEVRK